MLFSFLDIKQILKNDMDGAKLKVRESAKSLKFVLLTTSTCAPNLRNPSNSSSLKATNHHHQF